MLVAKGIASLLIAAACALAPVGGQLGCPMLGCDGRGLFYQADISLQQPATKRWSVKTGGVPLDFSLGCVGNDDIAVCFSSAAGRPRGLVAIDMDNGSVSWWETKLHDPGLPILNLAGDAIATDGNCMVFVYANGTYLGDECFGGDSSLVSSLLQLKDKGQFFFVSRKSGLLALFGTDGVCIASTELLEKNGNDSYKWIPVNQPVLGDGAAYFIAKRNTTDNNYRIYAMAFNEFPPYLSVKWCYDLGPSQAIGDVNSTRMMSYDGIVMVALSQEVLWVVDAGTFANVTGKLPLVVTSMSLYDADTTPDAKDSTTVASGTLWLAATAFDCDSIYGIDFSSPFGRPTYNFSLCSILAVSSAKITARIATFGYHAEEQVLVVGVSITTTSSGGTGRLSGSAPPRFRGFAPEVSNYVVALSPVGESEAAVLWAVPTDSSEHVVRGQIVGVRSQYVVAYAGSETEGSVLYIG